MDRRLEKRMFPTRDFTYGSDSTNLNGVDNPASNIEESGSSKDIGRTKAGENLPLRMTESKKQKCPCLGEKSGLKVIILCIVIFSIAITIALVVQIHYGEPQVLPHGAVVSDYSKCSEIGSALMKKGGSAVDAAVATVLCLGVVHPHVTGLGGGGLMIIHQHGADNNSTALDFRETAPKRAFEIKSLNEPAAKAQLVGVPGQLSGLFYAHKIKGKLKWEEVVKPSIDLARNGFAVSKHLYNAVSQVNRRPETMSYIFDEDEIEEGQIVHRRQLAETLSIIAKEGADAFYRNDLGKSIISETTDQNGILSYEDFFNYTTIDKVPLNISWNDYIIEASPLPSSGPVFLMALKILENSSLISNYTENLELTSVLQALKMASQNFANLGDPKLRPEAAKYVDYMLNQTTINEIMLELQNGSENNLNGTVLDIQKSHATTVVAVDNGECYVTVVSGLGSPFGSRIVTKSGIVLNDAMKSFFVEEAKVLKNINNIIEPGKRPLTSYIPAFVSSKNKPCGTRFAIGSSDSSLLLEVMLRKLALDLSEKEALEAPRFVTSFTEKKIFTEQDHPENFTNDEVESLKKLGYDVISAANPYPSINLIMKYKDDIEAYADSRGGGKPDTF